jgi:aspartate racemase
MPRLLGVLGGMGPLATVDFLEKLVEETPAKLDQEHVPLIVYSVPQIPPRVAAITGGGESPLPAMSRGLLTLKQAGVEGIVIPCNTAHFWFEDLQRVTGLPILHIVDAICAELPKGGAGARVGLLGTEATLTTRIYQDRLASQGIEFLVNEPSQREKYVLPAIAAVKQGKLRDAGESLERAIAQLLDLGVQTVVLACTELPIALAAIQSKFLPNSIDPTRALARAAVRWSLDDNAASTA